MLFISNSKLAFFFNNMYIYVHVNHSEFARFPHHGCFFRIQILKELCGFGHCISLARQVTFHKSCQCFLNLPDQER